MSVVSVCECDECLCVMSVCVRVLGVVSVCVISVSVRVCMSVCVSMCDVCLCDDECLCVYV